MLIRTLSKESLASDLAVGGYNLLRALSGGYKVQSGSVTLSITTGGTGVSANVTFPVSFSTTPIIFVACAGYPVDNVYNNIDSRGAGPTGFTPHFNSSSAQSITLYWIALGN